MMKPDKVHQQRRSSNIAEPMHTPGISVIIVSYYATPITHLCLWSLTKSNLTRTEVIVANNAAGDSYMEKLAEDFPFIRIIHNSDNIGFGKACNRAFKDAKGDIILFLNPDTIVPEDFEEKISGFFQTHPRAGAMGAQMIDARGCFLQESKRNFPRPLAAFLKFSGLNKLAPPTRSNLHYYARQISQNTTAQTEILSGSFLAVTREAIQKTGGFDPRYFLYAEDIDLSWTIARNGFEVWYNPNLKVVHLKGETTRKSPDYSKFFYESMMQFYEKHYSSKQHLFLHKLGLTAIRGLSVFSSIRHRFRSRLDYHQPAKIYLHPASCQNTLHQIRSLLPFQVITSPQKQSGKTPYLLVSTQNLLPGQLINNMAKAGHDKARILLWHAASGHLIFIKNARHQCLTRPLTDIK